MLDSFQSFGYVSDYFNLVTKLSKIFITTKVTTLIKFIPETSKNFLQDTYKPFIIKQPVYFSRAFELWATFEIQIDITLTIIWKILGKCIFQKAHISFPKHGNIHINEATNYKATTVFFLIKEKSAVFTGCFFLSFFK